MREKSGVLSGVLLASLRALLSRAEELGSRAEGIVQTGVLAGEMLGRAIRVVRSPIAAIEQLEAGTSELRALGL